MRHRSIGDAELTQRLQAILYRYGTDGAEALIDEYVSVPSAEQRAICLEALRGLRRTNDALFALVRDTHDLVVRQAAGILGELRDARGEQLLIELLLHPDARATRERLSACHDRSRGTGRIIRANTNARSPIARDVTGPPTK